MLIWHSSKDKPLLSGTYIVIMYGRVDTVPYSTRWDAWNAYDREDEPYYAIPTEYIQAWAYLSREDISNILQEVGYSEK